MALLTLANILDEVRDEIPGKEQAPVVRALNKVIRRLHTELVEPTRGTFTTSPKVTTGTVDVTQGSASVTFSSGILTSSDPVALVQITGDSVWFMLTYGGADTDGTLSSAWAQADNATATFTIVYPTVSLPSGVGRCLRSAGMARTASPSALSGASRTPRARRLVEPVSGGLRHRVPDDDKFRLFLGPAPLDRKVYSYWYKRRTTLLSAGGATTQTVPFSDLWYDTIVHGVLYYLWKQEGEPQKALLAKALYDEAVMDAQAASQPAAIIQPRAVNDGLYAYEERPISNA